MDGVRSGEYLIHDNTFTGVKPNGFGLGYYRGFYADPGTPWLGASGGNDWDVNVTEPDGTHIDGHPPYLFDSGTVTSGSENCGNALMFLTDSSKNWITNQWVGYTAVRPSDNVIGYILGNTSNTLTMMYYYPNGDCLSRWRLGNSYQIHKVLIGMDQPGRGEGDLLTGDNPPAAWPNQALEGSYSWNNIHSPGGEHVNFTPYFTTMQLLLPGRDYFNDTAKPGYAPYVYPHPLVSGATPTPTPIATVTPSASPTSSPTPTATATATFTPTPTATATFTPTATATATSTPSATPVRCGRQLCKRDQHQWQRSHRKRERLVVGYCRACRRLCHVQWHFCRYDPHVHTDHRR